MIYDDDDTRSWWSKDTVVAVTGSNKGLGYEIVRGLAKQGLTTVLTARDPARGLTALQTLQAEGLDSVHFHQLDVTDTDSVKRLAAWLQKEFGGFDILVRRDDEEPTSCDPCFYHHILQKHSCKRQRNEFSQLGSLLIT
jgi:hypothetical protein